MTTALIPGDRACLAALFKDYDGDYPYLSFRTIASRTGLDTKEVRRRVRRLARKGLAEFGKGLWTDDGTPAGSGYCITAAGMDACRGGQGDE